MKVKLRSNLFLVFAILLELFLFFMPREIMYSDMEWIKWICMLGVIFLFIPICLFNGLKRIISALWVVQCIAMISVPLNGITFGTYHQNKELKELRNDGLWTIGVVIDREYKSGKRQGYWAVQLEYYINNVRFITDWKEDEKDEIGQSLDIIYLNGFPKIYRVRTEGKTREHFFD